MDYYRKGAAVFILVLTLLLPLFMEVEEKVAVIDISALIKESETLSKIEQKSNDSSAARGKIMELVEEAAAKYAENNYYSSVITKYGLYKGGENITGELAQKIDEEN